MSAPTRSSKEDFASGTVRLSPVTRDDGAPLMGAPTKSSKKDFASGKVQLYPVAAMN